MASRIFPKFCAAPDASKAEGNADEAPKKITKYVDQESFDREIANLKTFKTQEQIKELSASLASPLTIILSIFGLFYVQLSQLSSISDKISVLVDKLSKETLDRSLSDRIIIEKTNNIEGRLDGVDKRLNGIDGRLDGVDKRLNGIDGRLDGIDGRLNGIDGRIKSKLILGKTPLTISNFPNHFINR